MKFVIIGGVAGGAACATRLRRLFEKAEITVIEKTSWPSFANCALPYYLGGVVPHREQLFAVSANELRKKFNLDLRIDTEAVAIDPNEHLVTVVSNGKEEQISYDKLILAPGANPKMPDFARNVEGVYALRTIADTDAIMAKLQGKIKKAVVIGGGFIGLETAENLSHRGIEVDLIEAAPHIMPSFDKEMSNYICQSLEQKGVKVHVNTRLNDLKKQADGSLTVITDKQNFDADLVIVGMGIAPNSELAVKANLKVGPFGHIVTDEHMQTSDKDIFAVGDVIQVKNAITNKDTALALAGPISKQVRALSGFLIGKNHPFKGVLGTSACKIFDMVAASTGLSEEMAHKLGYENISAVWTHTLSTPGFYPNSTMVHCKLVFNKNTREILGAQACGNGDAVKTIEVISSLLQFKGDVDDLVSHEHAYAPPVGASRDAVCILGAVAQNVCDGLMQVARFDELETKFKDALIVDVRPRDVYEQGHYERSINIPLMQLRDRLAEMPQDKDIIFTCMVGQTAFYAARMLAGMGYDRVYVLSGSYQTIKIAGLA